MDLGQFSFDAASGALSAPDGTAVELKKQAQGVLRCLVEAEGEVVSKDALLDAVWPNVTVSEDSLYQAVAELRRSLDGADLIETVPREGYRLRVQGKSARRPQRWRWIFGAAGLALGALVVAVAVWWSTPAAPPPDERPPSIAVLPFEAMDDDARWTRLGRGLAADIASELARNDWLYVTLPESLINVAFGELAAPSDLDVRFVLKGTLQAQGEEIRISSQLTDAATSKVLWSETWTEPQNDIFLVQQKIIDRIGSNLTSTYSGVVALTELKRAKRKLTDDLNAYEHYLVAFEDLHRFDLATYPEVIRHLETALEIDPDFAGAMVTLSVAQRILAENTEGDTTRSWFEASQDWAYRAYAADPNNPNVLWNVACAYALDGQMEIAATTLRRAVETAPNNADVLMIAAGYSGLVGVTGPEPLEWASRALELNPLAPAWWYSDMGEAAFAAGKYDLAIESMERAPPSSTSRWLITALAHAHNGEFSAARKAGQRFRELAPGMTIEDFAGGTEANRPDQHRLFEGARLASLPITAEDLISTETPSIAVLPFEDITSNE